MSNHKPPTVSIKELSKAVDHAVSLAREKHKVQFAPGISIHPGTIIGRQVLQAELSIHQAQQIATDLTHQITEGKAGVAGLAGEKGLEPFFFGGRNILICGFIPGPIWEVRE